MKRWSFVRAVFVTVWLGAAVGLSPAARAVECIVNSTPVAPTSLVDTLEFGGGAPFGQLAGVPFNVMSLQQLNVTWSGCGQDCVTYQFLGETQCGDLVTTPIESAFLALYPDENDASIINNVAARQTAEGRWRISAQGWVIPGSAPEGAQSSYSFELGTREVIDVASSGGTDPLPLSIGIRAGTWLTLSLCDQNGYFRWNPTRRLHFRASQQLPLGAPTPLVSTVYYENFLRVDDVFSVEVTPGATLTVDVYLYVAANATGAVDTLGNQCFGSSALLDMDPGFAFPSLGGGSAAYDGIQLAFSPDPALTLTPRSGIEYPTTVPEPGAFASAAAALAALLLVRRKA